MLEIASGSWQQAYQFHDESFAVVHTVCDMTVPNDDAAIDRLDRVAYMFKGQPLKDVYVTRKNNRDGTSWTMLPWKYNTATGLYYVLEGNRWKVYGSAQ
jgi:hypothetical protein